MPYEIEHKYLVKPELWNKVKPENSLAIIQAYLCVSPEKTIRLRTLGHTAFITIKGKTEKAKRKEYEYEIPYAEAKEMIDIFGENVIVKTRHYIHHDGHLWEVDEFFEQNRGLMIAEIELASQDETYTLPEWAGENVTDDVRFYNSYLIEHPFIDWV